MDGLCQYKVLPFDRKNISSSFQRLVSKVLKNVFNIKRVLAKGQKKKTLKKSRLSPDPVKRTHIIGQEMAMMIFSSLVDFINCRYMCLEGLIVVQRFAFVCWQIRSCKQMY